jgi:hypothetical protein
MKKLTLTTALLVGALSFASVAEAFSSTRCYWIGSTYTCTTVGGGGSSTTRCTTIGSTVRCTTF